MTGFKSSIEDLIGGMLYFLQFIFDVVELLKRQEEATAAGKAA